MANVIDKVAGFVVGPQGPQGLQGPKGDTGQTGPQGERGATGATPSLTMGTVTTLEPDSPATATITGTAENPVLNLGLPKGRTGEISQAEFDEVAGDVDELKSELTDTTAKMEIKESVNRSVSDESWTNGYYVDNRSGKVVASATLAYSQKIPVSEGEVIRIFSFYNYTFRQMLLRSIAAYAPNGDFISTPDATGWKVQEYTVPSGVTSIIITTSIASQYMVVANIIPTKYIPYSAPHYVATYDFISDAVNSGNISTLDLKNSYACALPKGTFYQTVGLPQKWYKDSMVTPKTDYVFVANGYSATIHESDGALFENDNAINSANGYIYYAHDVLLNRVFYYDDGTGYGARRQVKVENLSDCSLLAIGDSTVDQDVLTATLLSHFAEQEHTITLLGTLGGSDPLNRNEGRAGWTTQNYMENTEKNGYTNPFYNSVADGFDFSYYMAQQGYSGVDFVVIQLGINDLYQYLSPNYAVIWSNIKTMIDSIHNYDANIKIILNLPTTPNSNEREHSVAEYLYRNRVITYNALALEESRKLPNVRCSYCHLILNSATDIRDNVHPTSAGYEKMALEVVNQINCWQN